MANINVNFDDVNEDDFSAGGSSGPIPAGWYRCRITGTDIRDNNAGTGQFLEVEYTVVEGEHENRKFWDRMNFQHSNPKAVKIARAGMKRLAIACGIAGGRLTDTTQLDHRVVQVKVGVEKGKRRPDGSGYYQDRNRPEDWKSAGGAAQGAGGFDDDDIPF